MDSGIIWEIDLVSQGFPILDQGVLAALPQSLFYVETDSGTDKLLAYCVEIHSMEFPRASRTDIIALVRGLPREEQILCTFVSEYCYANNIVAWSPDEFLAALCNTHIYYESDCPEYMDGIWIINTETNDVVQTVSVPDSNEVPRGCRYAHVSLINPGWVYASLGSSGSAIELVIINHETGSYVDSVDLGGIGVSGLW